MERPLPGGVTWTITAERLAVLAWPRAILLQFAHPLVAAGVGAHSGFRSSALAPFVRLHATVTAMRQLAFGTDAQAREAAARIKRVHDGVHGTLRHGTGVHAKGTPYSAHDPALLLWVHATLLDSHVRVLERALRPFAPDELDTYCRESAPFAEVLGAAAGAIPRDWPALQAYMGEEIASGRVAVGAQARDLAMAVLRPRGSIAAWPVQRALEAFTVGTLPDTIRAQYGFPWGPREERRMARAIAVLRRGRRIVPATLALWPEARAAYA